MRRIKPVRLPGSQPLLTRWGQAGPACTDVAPVLVTSHSLVDPSVTACAEPLLGEGHGRQGVIDNGDLAAEAFLIVLLLEGWEFDQVVGVLATDVLGHVKHQDEATGCGPQLGPLDPGNFRGPGRSQKLLDRTTTPEGGECECFDEVAHSCKLDVAETSEHC
ncbi:hypothetical protein ACWGHM_42710 [Streptomyces sp. NPDC054904]